LIPITIGCFVSPGGSGKAEGFADGEWANHRQAALGAATQGLMLCYEELMRNGYDASGSGGVRILRVFNDPASGERT
jgi:hypothetical protein